MANNAMTGDDRKRLVEGYIEHHTKRFVWGADNVLRQQDVNFWTWEKLDQLVRNEPETAWDIILEVMNNTEDEFTLSCLAAGALEDLIRRHGARFIDRIERQAKSDARFRELLCGVWRGSTPEVWARIEALQEGQV